MAKSRTVHSAAFKAKLALAAVLEVETVSQLAAIYGVHPTQIHKWKKQLLEGAAGVFESGANRKRRAKDEARSAAELNKQIARLKREREWLESKTLPAD